MLEMYVCEDILEMSETNEVVVTMRTKKQTWKKKEKKREPIQRATSILP